MTESMPPTPEEVRQVSRQLSRRLNEQVLEQAAADPQWKQRFLDDPAATTAEFAEAQRLREMYETGALPAAGAMPTPQEEYRRLQRSLWEKVRDTAASAPEWTQPLLANPAAAMGEFAEAHRLGEMVKPAEMRERAGEEVYGQRRAGGGLETYTLQEPPWMTCVSPTCHTCSGSYCLCMAY
jgi:hypothetical protein